MRSLSIAATGMLAQQLNVEVISNNIANMNTTGFKRQRAEFQDLLYQTVERVGSTSSESGTIVPAGVQIGLGVTAAAVYNIAEQGNLTATSNPLDVAISGAGYFQVTLPNSDTAYTRAGSFQLSPTGEIVTGDGYTVAPAITIPSNALQVTINKSGQVLVQLPNVVAESIVGQLQLANFPNPRRFGPTGRQFVPRNRRIRFGNYGYAGNGRPWFNRTGICRNLERQHGYRDTNLITAQRAYEMNSKVIQTSDEMLSTINRLR